MVSFIVGVISFVVTIILDYVLIFILLVTTQYIDFECIILVLKIPYWVAKTFCKLVANLKTN